jgi:small subunit ribosomal protein S17
VPEPESPEPTPEPAPPAEPVAEVDEEAPVAAEGEEAPAEEQAAAPAAAPARKKRKRVPRSERRQRPKPKREQTAERKPIKRLPKPVGERGRRQERRGVVVSAAMDKTIVVRVDVVKAHPRYKKVVRRSQRFHAHDEQNQAKAGDVVRIVETRPLSKTKNWRLAEVVEAAK